MLAWPARRTTRAIIVSDNENGPLTILDGNHRLVLLQHENALVGAPVYLGLHAAMGRFGRAVPSYTTSP